MITKSNILIDYKSKSELEENLKKLTSCFDIDFSISEYDYFNIDEYKEYVKGKENYVHDDIRFIDILSDVDFLYEIELGTSLSSIESNYLPVLTDFIAQSLSFKLHCNAISGFNSLNGEEGCPVTYFSNGKDIISFADYDSSIWKKVTWIKS